MDSSRMTLRLMDRSLQATLVVVELRLGRA
jgi:hypothetical protein